MSGSLNKVILIGNLGKSPETRFTQDSKKVVSFSLATTESWRDKVTNERKDKTEWHKIVIFNERLGDIANQYLQKGSKVYIEGQLQTRKWTDKEGKEQYTTEIILSQFNGEIIILGFKDKNASGHEDSQIAFKGELGTYQQQQANNPFGNAELNDEVPF